MTDEVKVKVLESLLWKALRRIAELEHVSGNLHVAVPERQSISHQTVKRKMKRKAPSLLESIMDELPAPSV